MAARSVLVGIDISAEVIDALRWALVEGRAREIVLAHAPDRSDAALARSAHVEVGTEPVARILLEVYRTIAIRIAPEATIRTLVLDGEPADALVTASRDASLVVLGSRGISDLARSALGSVGQRVAVHAHCPVVVVPAAPRPTPVGTIVVGVADEPAGRQAVDFAADAADRNHKTLLMIRSAQLSDRGRAPSVEHVTERLGELSARYPHLQIRTAHTERDAAEALKDAAREADLLVVGCHHADDRFSSRLGSVPAALLGQVGCPVALVGRTRRAVH